MDPRTSAQDVMRCNLCETAVVQMHCDTCLVNLCKACVGEHFSADLSNPHKIVDIKDRRSTPLCPACTSHVKERCEMYCNQCDIPICVYCNASDQHQGHKISTLMQVYDEKKEKMIKERKELNETIYPTYQAIAFDVQNRMSQLEEEYGDLSTAITKHGEEWHRELDKLVKKLKAEVDEMKNTQLQTLQKQLDDINKKMSDIKDEINSIDVSLDTYNISERIGFSINITEYRKLPQKKTLSFLKFSPGEIKGEQLQQLFGALSPIPCTENSYSINALQKSTEAGFPPPVKQLLDEPETITKIDTGYEYLYNVACLCDKEIWTRGNDSTMKLFSINQGSLLKSMKTKSGKMPCDIAVTESGDLVYTDYYDRTVNIVKNEKIEEVIRLQNWRPRGICSTSSGDLLVIMYIDDRKQTNVARYSGSTEKQTIQFDNKGQPLYSSGIRYITENRNLDICVADNEAKEIVVVNQAGKLRFRYTGHTPAPKKKSFNPRGITTDSQSHILTVDGNSHCVHIIDKDGQFIRYIVCGLKYPYGLCTDTNDNLFVTHTEQGREEIFMIKYMHF